MSVEHDIRVEKIRIDLLREEVTDAITGERAILRPQAERLLLVLAGRSGKVVTKKELMAIVWPDTIVTDDSIVQAIRDIRLLLEDDKRQIVRTVHRLGYRFIPPVIPASSKSATTASTVRQPPENAQRQKLSKVAAFSGATRLWLVITVIAVLTTALIGYQLNREVLVNREVAQLSLGIAVLPFRSPDSGSYGEWLAEDLVRAFARNQNIRVVSSYSSFALRNESLSAAQWQSTLNVRYLVDGHTAKDGETLTIDVQLTDLTRDQIIWSGTFTTNDATVYKLQQSIIEEVAGSLLTGARHSSRLHALAASEPASLDVYENTQRAIALKHLFSAKASEQARLLLDRVITLDEGYAPAWAALCWINALDGIFRLTGKWSQERAPEIVEQCRRSLALAPNNPIAHLALADASLFAGKLILAESAARRATEVAPGDAEAWLLYGFHQLPVRPAHEALAAVKRANRLFPIKPAYVHLITAQAAWAATEFKVAKSNAQSCLLAAPHLVACRAVLALVAAELDDMAGLRKARRLLQSESQSTLRNVCNRFAGDQDRQQQCLRHLLSP